MSETVLTVPKEGKRMKYNGQVINDKQNDTRKPTNGMFHQSYLKEKIIRNYPESYE